MFFFYDQEANKTFDAYFPALRRLPCSCEFGQLKEELIRGRMVLGIKHRGVRACMLREPSLTLDQAAMMCWSSEEQEVSYARGHRQDGNQPQKDQKNDSDKKRDNQGKQDFWRGGNKKASCGYCGRKGKHRPPEACLTWGERCEKWGKNNHFAKVCKQRTTALHQLQYSEESSSNESTYIIGEEIANFETKKKQLMGPIMIKTKSSKRIVECQIDSGAPCNVVISHSLICKLLQDENQKLQEG